MNNLNEAAEKHFNEEAECSQWLNKLHINEVSYLKKMLVDAYKSEAAKQYWQAQLQEPIQSGGVWVKVNDESEVPIWKGKIRLTNIEGGYNYHEADANRIKKLLRHELDLDIHYLDESQSTSIGYVGEDLEQYLDERIKQLNEADALFCADRWDRQKPDYARNLAREESNKVTFARQELQAVKSKLQSKQITDEEK